MNNIKNSVSMFIFFSMHIGAQDWFDFEKSSPNAQKRVVTDVDIEFNSERKSKEATLLNSWVSKEDPCFVIGEVFINDPEIVKKVYVPLAPGQDTKELSDRGYNILLPNPEKACGSRVTILPHASRPIQRFAIDQYKKQVIICLSNEICALAKRENIWELIFSLYLSDALIKNQKASYDVFYDTASPIEEVLFSKNNQYVKLIGPKEKSCMVSLKENYNKKFRTETLKELNELKSLLSKKESDDGLELKRKELLKRCDILMAQHEQ